MDSCGSATKYWRWYMQIVERARPRALAVGMERHHVLPKSMGGSNDASNLVCLTYREHFLAHWLLVKITSGQDKKKMCHALWSLTRPKDGKRVFTSSQYATARQAHRSMLMGNQYARGYQKTEEERAAMSLVRIGRKFTAEHKEKIGSASKGNKRALGCTRSHETRLKMSKPKSAETRAKMSAALIGNKRGLGHRHSAESKAKMCAARKAR